VFEIPRVHEEPPIVISGDVLFEGTIGRTDIPGGDVRAMERSLRNVILPMDDDCVVLPGHGARTTIGRERATNPYLREILAGGTIVPPRRGV
jgi:glyoxylase-like metal-dependent hydrolase (beta-lactamase superfamily II)